jgi:hypothetical protein
MNKEFKVGDVVAWTGRANGGSREHSGVVVGIVPPGMSAMKAWPDFAKRLKDGGFSRREHTSYLISDKTSDRIWWPVVSGLTLVASAEALQVPVEA